LEINIPPKHSQLCGKEVEQTPECCGEEMEVFISPEGYRFYRCKKCKNEFIGEDMDTE